MLRNFKIIIFLIVVVLGFYLINLSSYNHGQFIRIKLTNDQALVEIADKLFDFNVNTDYDIRDSSIKLLETVVKVFDANNLTYWAQGGTLLGAVKNRGMLPWDDDQDLCVMMNDFEKFLSLKQQFSILDILTVPNMFFYKLRKVNHTRISIDIFFYFRSENNSLLLYDLKTKNEVKDKYFINDYFKNYSDVFPLKFYNYEYFKLYGPNNPSEYLNRAFSNWKQKSNSYRHLPNKFNFNKRSFPTYYYRQDEKLYLWLGNKSNMIKYKANFSDLFEAISFENNDTISKYASELFKFNLNKNMEYYLVRLILVYKYGGVFIKSDELLLNNKINLTDVIDKLKAYEFVAFGCSDLNKDILNYKCVIPSSDVMASRPKQTLIENVMKSILTLNNQNLSDALFESLIWKEISYLMKIFKFEYYHYQ